MDTTPSRRGAIPNSWTTKPSSEVATCVGVTFPPAIPEERFLKRREKRLNGPEDTVLELVTLPAMIG